jgi:myo-inositol-1(or 4)-monophosphatase
MTTSRDLTALLEFARDTAKRSGDMIHAARSAPLRVSPKGENDFVTDLDFASQEMIIQAIQREYPDHGAVGEESTPSSPGPQQFTWVIDPIDGTVNYIRQRPIYCVSIGLLIDDEPTIGVTYDPVNGELFSAASGFGFYINGTRVRSEARVENLRDAAVGLDWETSAPLRRRTSENIQNLIMDVQTIPIIGSVALALAWIAAGRIDAYFRYKAESWDITAGAVMIEESGGRVSNHNDAKWNWRSNDKSILASNGVLHQALLSYFK